MTRFSKPFSTLTLVLPVLMLAGPAKAEMTGDQIKAAVSDNTFILAQEYGTINLAADGTASVTLNSGAKQTWKWRINGNQFCTQIEGGQESCATLKDEGGEYVTSNGFTLTPQ